MEDKLYWIWLSLKEMIPMRERLMLLRMFGDIKALYETSCYDVSLKLAPETENELMDKSMTEAERIYHQVEDMGGYIITLGDKEYPNYLRSIAVPPLVLYCKGKHIDWENTFRITVVGTREYCDYGRKATEYIVKGLVGYGTAIVSGMARGIDAIAACAALHEGGETIAVLGSGLDVIYPPEYRSLYNHITKNGVVMTEFPPGTKPLKQNFPRRNRIMTGLSLGLLVGQAPAKSGALISAAHAEADGRNVYAIASNIFDEDFAGSHDLIKAGAKLVCSAEDIIEDFEYLGLKKQDTKKQTAQKIVNTAGLNEDEVKIVNLLKDHRLHVDELMRRSDIDGSDLSTALLMLEINGVIKKFKGDIYGIE